MYIYIRRERADVDGDDDDDFFCRFLFFYNIFNWITEAGNNNDVIVFLFSHLLRTKKKKKKTKGNNGERIFNGSVDGVVVKGKRLEIVC
jgi:hypothetical protein